MQYNIVLQTCLFVSYLFPPIFTHFLSKKIIRLVLSSILNNKNIIMMIIIYYIILLSSFFIIILSVIIRTKYKQIRVRNSNQLIFNPVNDALICLKNV